MMQFTIAIAVFAVPLFLAAGRLDWIDGWLCIGLLWAPEMIRISVLSRRNPEVLVERAQLPFSEGAKGWDRVLMMAYLPLVFILFVVAGLDAGRYAWSSISPALRIASIVVFLLFGPSLVGWAMAVNKHFEKLARVQRDRDHAVCTSGPYRYVRHPGYLAAIVAWLSAPLILGSWLALIPAFLLMALFITRTALEDRTLRQELPGYAEYAQKTRYRLFPGVW